MLTTLMPINSFADDLFIIQPKIRGLNSKARTSRNAKPGRLKRNCVHVYFTRPSPITSLTFQPMLSYQLGHDWYVRSSDATWNLNLRHGTSTTIPLSTGVGKVSKVSNGAAINGSIAGEWMVTGYLVPEPTHSL